MACHQAEADWVDHSRGNDRDDGGRLSHRDCRLRVAGHQNVGLEPDQLVHERRQTRQVAVGVAVHNVDVAARDIAELLHALRKASHVARCRCRRCSEHDSDEGAPGRDLREDAARPRGRRAAEKGDELPSLHVVLPESFRPMRLEP